MEGYGITIYDYLLLPFYLVVIYKIAFYYRDKYYPEGHPYRAYFINGLTIKIIGAIFIGLVYQYYYGGGDTFNFFYHSKVINETFSQAPQTWFRLLTHHADETNLTDAEALSKMYWYDDYSSYLTACFGAFIGIFCFTKYLIINILSASFSFIGIWLLFVTFANQYGSIIKYIAIAILFMPGPIVWGSGLFKDTFCMFAIGCIMYSTYILFEKRQLRFGLIILWLIAALILVFIKLYIIAVLVPMLIVKLLIINQKAVKNNPAKKIAFYVVVLFLVTIIYKIAVGMSSFFSSFSTEDVLVAAKVQKDYLLRVSLDQSGAAYDLGDFEPSIKGISKLIIPALNVTLFRPYLWESQSIIQLFNALESFAMLLATLYILVKRKLLNILTNIYRDPNLIFCLLFTLFFAFIVGVTSYNFGSLSRYKIPCTPFFALLLVVLIFGDKAKEGGLNNSSELEKK